MYLDKEVKEFFNKTASKKNIGLYKIVNTILRKEMEMLKAMEYSGYQEAVACFEEPA